MRLVCPSCGAQYQIDDAAIPDAGRDVQCSNCGHAWFQLPPALEAALEAEEDRAARSGAAPAPPPQDAADEPPPAPPEATPAAPTESPVAAARRTPPSEAAPEPASAPEPEPAPEPQPHPAPRSDTGPAADPDPLPPPEPQTPVAAAAPPPPPPQRNVDESVLAIVREEAEREARARRADAAALESQPDLGLQPRPQRVRPATTGRPPTGVPPEAPPEPERPGRRKQLPDIDEINSSLHPAPDRSYADLVDDADAEDDARTRRRGFRIGFFAALGLGAVLLLAYLMAPTLTAQIPALEPVLTAYVGALDAWRGVLSERLDSAIRALTERIS